MAKTTWRFNFIEENASFSINTADSDIIGYTVVRAPKGNKEPYFFPAGNTEALKQMIGYPTCHYADIAEAISFNEEFGLYVSAPAGGSDDYPSYFGGEYITKYGLYPFYHVTDKDNPNYEVAVKPGKEKNLFRTVNGASQISVSSLTDGNTQGTITISGIPSKVFAKMQYIDFDFWGNKKGAKKGMYRYVLKKNINELHVLVNDKEMDISVGTITKVSATNTYTIILGNGENTRIMTKIPFIDFAELIQYSNDDLESPEIVDNIKQSLLNGTYDNNTPEDELDDSVFIGMNARLNLIVDVESFTKAYVSQVTPTEVPTNVKLSGIGYDKWLYDQSLTAICQLNRDLNANDFEKYCDNDDGLILVYNSEPGGPTPGIYQYMAQDTYDDDGNEISVMKWVNVTNDYRTQTIYARRIVVGELGVEFPLFYIDFDNSIVNMDTESDVPEFKPKANINFNTIDLSCSEDGISGGSWHGSLQEGAVDEYGADIFFPNIFPNDESMTFIELHVVDTFDDCLDVNGFYTATRIIDKIGPGDTSVAGNVVGQRYVTHMVDRNIEEGTVGKTYRKEFYDLINSGIQQFKEPKYDEVNIMFECTGQDVFKSALAGCREAHKFTTIVSPKIITEAEAANPKIMVVSGRKRGTAQYVGEFQVKCPYTGKKYWISPIGDVARMLANIMKKRYGGVAPMWENSDDMGGQLYRSVLKAKYDFTDLATKIMDEKGVNPIVLDKDDGVMMLSHKTTELDSGDWSYLGHTMAFDLCEREIRDKVMRPQIGKAIDDYHFDLAEGRLQPILNKRTSGSRAIWDSTAYQIREANTNATKNQRTFVIKVRVKVNVFAEFVTLIFTNVDQETSVTEF